MDISVTIIAKNLSNAIKSALNKNWGDASRRQAEALVLFILSIIIIGSNLSKPFVGIHDWNGARYGQIARNYLEKGWLTLKFGQLQTGNEYYTHFPLLLPILISISYYLLGVSELTTRLVPLVTTSLSIVAIYLLVSAVFSRPLGVIAALASLFTPLVRYYGKNPVHEPVAFLFLLVVAIGTARVLQHKKLGWAFIYLGLLLLGLTNWMGGFVFLGVAICLYRKEYSRQLFGAALLVIGTALLHFWQIHLITGAWDGGGVLLSLWQRMGIQPLTTQDNFTLLEFVVRVRIWAQNMFTVTLLVIAGLGVVTSLLKKNLAVIRLGLGLFIASWGYALFFSNAAYIHEYFFYSGLLFIIVSACLGFIFLSRVLKINLMLVGVIVLTMIWFEKSNYISALNGSNHDGLAVEIGQAIKKTVPVEDTVLIIPTDYGQSRRPHLLFYSHRHIISDPRTSYQWLATVSSDKSSYALTSLP